MINKKEFDLLLQEIFQIENKIVEIKISKQFEKAREFENDLEIIRMQAKDIVLDDENKSEGFDELSLDVLAKLISLDTNIDYYILKLNNIIESTNENKIDEVALKKIKRLWDSLEMDIEIWNRTSHNPIEEIEYSKHIGKITLHNIICQLETEGVLDFFKVFKYCKKELLVNAIKETLFEGAKEEFQDEIKRNILINLAKKVSEKDLYDYKIWQQILMIKKVRSRDDHIEILGNFQEKNNKLNISNHEYDTNKNVFSDDEENALEYYEDYVSLNFIKDFFYGIYKFIINKQMKSTWGTIRGPAFKLEFEDGTTRFSQDFIDKKSMRKVKKLTIATRGISKYNFDKDSEWSNLEEIEFLEDKDTSSINLNPNKLYNCIGNNSFENCPKLKNINLGKIEMLGENAFQNCEEISEIIFPRNLINIRRRYFFKLLKTYKGKIFRRIKSLYFE